VYIFPYAYLHRMTRQFFVITGIFLLSVQILSLPLSIGYFYANQAEIAATQCENRMETVVLCSGRCVLREIVSSRIEVPGQDDPVAPASQSERLLLTSLDIPPAIRQIAVIAHRPRLILPATNYAYQLPATSGYLKDVFQPPQWG